MYGCKHSNHSKLQCSQRHHQLLEEKPTPNAIIAAGTAIIIGSVPLHCRHPKEVEDEVVVNNTIEDDVVGQEEDAVGDNKVPKEYQRMLL